MKTHLSHRSSRGLLLPLMVLAGLSGIIATVLMGIIYPHIATPRAGWGVLQNISSDGWTLPGASIRFSDLATRGNVLNLRFTAWRPEGNPPAQYQVAVCGAVTAEFEVRDELPKPISLKGDCEPRLIELRNSNPFTVSAEDNRSKGAQLLSAEVTSRFGIPLIDPGQVALVALALLVLALLAYSCVPARFGMAVGVTVLALSAAVLSRADSIALQQEMPLWLCCVSLLGGLRIAQLLPRDALAVVAVRSTLTERGQWVLLAAVVALAGGLRFYGLSFGLPANFHPDEVPKVNAIMRMVGNGNFDPQYFLHPTLLLYATYGMNSLFHLFGMEGAFRDSAFLAGRTVSAVAGTLSIVWIFLIGRRLFSSGVGLMAAALLAVFPLHVTCSRYLKEDSLLVCFVLLCTWATLKAVGDNRRWWLLVAGLFGGLAAGTKYPGLLTFCIIGGAPWLKSRQLKPDTSFLAATALGILCIPLFFVATTPYSLITPAKFLTDFRSEQHHMARGHTIAITSWSQLWMYHFWRSLLPGTHLLTALFGTAALGLLLWRRRIEDLYVICLFLLYYFPAEYVRAKPEPQPERYIVPCLPIIALAAGEMLRVLSRSNLRRIVPAVFALLFTLPLIRSVQLASEVPYDTRDRAADWMRGNLPPGSSVALDWKPYAPPILGGAFKVDFIPRSTILERLRINRLKNSEADYLVLSSLWYDRYFTQPHPHATLRQLFRDLFEQVPIVAEFDPTYGTYGFHNPRITVFSLKPEDFARLEQELAEKRAGERLQTSNETRAIFRW